MRVWVIKCEFPKGVTEKGPVRQFSRMSSPGVGMEFIFWVFKLSRVNYVYEFPQFSLQVLNKIPLKYF